MKLVRVADLVGLDIKGLEADIRSRNADGSLMHEHLEKDGPVIVSMESVRFHTEKAGPTNRRTYGKDDIRWMRWTWSGQRGSGCNYSGVVAEDSHGGHLAYHIMMAERAAS